MRRVAVEITPRADRDLDDIYDRIASDNPEAATRFGLAARHAFDTLATAPKAGVERPSKSKRLRGLRMWPIPEFEVYLAYYSRTRAGIRIIRVLHGARDVRRILNLL